MATENRPRGRPPGEGKDSPYLAQVADLVVSDSSLKPTTAMKRVMRSRNHWGASDETLLRRWQVKWKANHKVYLAAALNLSAAQPRPVRRSRRSGNGTS